MLCPDLDNEEESVWMADELEPCAFARLGEMKVVSSRFTAVTSKLNAGAKRCSCLYGWSIIRSKRLGCDAHFVQVLSMLRGNWLMHGNVSWQDVGAVLMTRPCRHPKYMSLFFDDIRYAVAM